MLRLGTKVDPKAVGCVGENKVIRIFNVVTISQIVAGKYVVWYGNNI